MPYPEKVVIEKQRLFFKRNEFHEKMWTIIYIILSLSFMTLDHGYNKLEKVKFFVGSCIKPVQEYILNITELPYIVTSALANALTNAKKVSALSMELSHKRIEENYLLSLKEQNENLLHILKLVNENSHTHLVAAQIVQIGLNPFINEITLNKGLSDSIALGDPVINEQGLIGQVTRLYQHHAEVTLLTEINQETPVKILPNNDIGIAFGRGKFIEISYLPDDVKTSPGDSVVTSGLDGLYPGQIKIGTVTKIVTNADKSVRVIAKPIATERLSPYVSVISSPHKVNLGDERYIATQNHLCKQ